MNVDKAVLAFAGCVVLLSVALGAFRLALVVTAHRLCGRQHASVLGDGLSAPQPLFSRSSVAAPERRSAEEYAEGLNSPALTSELSNIRYVSNI